jgi:hypothetical protein
LDLGAGGIAAGIIDHNIAAGLLDCKQHRVPLPKGHSKLDDAEDRKKQDGGDKCRFDWRRSFVLAAASVSPALHDDQHFHCVRTTVVAVTEAGKAKLAKEKIGLKPSVAVTVT